MLEWVAECLAADMPQASIKLYFELIDTILTAALADKQLVDNPCDGIRLSKILRGVSREPLWVPNETEVARLLRVVPSRYRAALYLGAGEGLRLGETLGMEAGDRCVEADTGNLHVVQQMQYSVKEYGGHYLCEPKAGSSGTIDLDPLVAEHLAAHVRQFPPVEVELPDITSGRLVRRAVPLLFTTTHGNPINDKIWSREWARWRAAAGWPTQHSGFHALRHFLATTLIQNHAEPKEVQWMLRHKTLRITMETYVSWWPKRDRRRGIVGGILAAAAEDYRGQTSP